MSAALTIRPDAYVVALPEGVDVVTGRGTTFLPGRSLALWMERLVPALDGTRSFDDVVGGVSPQRRGIAEKLITTLLRLGAVTELADAGGGGLDTAERDTWGSQIGFVGQFVADPGAAFCRYRRYSVTVLGARDVLPGIAEGLVSTGLTDVRLSSEGAAAGAVQGVDLVVHVMSGSDQHCSESVERECRRTGTTLLQVVLVGPMSWWCGPGSDARWSDIRARLTGLDPGWASGGGTQRHPDVSRAVLTNQVVQDAFCFLTRVRDGPVSPIAHEFDMASLADEAHPVRPHPFGQLVVAEDDNGFLQRMRDLTELPESGESGFSEAAVTLMDSRVGIFGDITQGTLPQLPLKAASACVADPVGLIGGDGGRPVVTHADLDFGQCRRRLGMRAIATYASLMLDPRRTVREASEVSADTDPWTALDQLRRGRRAALRGLDLVRQRVEYVDVREAFPALEHTAGPYTAPPGVGVGLSWRAALEDAMARHCRRLAIEQSRSGGGRADVVEVDVAALPEHTAQLMTLSRGLNRDVEIRDIGASIGVPTLVCMLDGEPAACGCGSSYERALEQCLLEALRHQQGLGPRDVDLPRQAVGGPGRVPPARSRMELADMVGCLAALGLRPVAVPLDHDPEVAAVLPYVVHVVLHEA